MSEMSEITKKAILAVLGIVSAVVESVAPSTAVKALATATVAIS